MIEYTFTESSVSVKESGHRSIFMPFNWGRLAVHLKKPMFMSLLGNLRMFSCASSLVALKSTENTFAGTFQARCTSINHGLTEERLTN